MNFRYLTLLGFVFCHFIGNSQNLNNTFRSSITFPGQTLANVWGYAAGGKEYALVGASKGLVIVDITNPDVPVQIVQLPGPDNLWKEIKTYQHYAYVTSEGGQGIHVVDLNGLPSASLLNHFYTGDGAIAGQLNTIHALQIDEAKGFLYAWGGGLFGGGAKIFDLKADPYNPKYVGKYDQLGYIHDGYVDNDTMYSCHIYAGQFAVVNMANKAAPELINTQTTPGAFVHNTWLTPDRKTILATDEVDNSFLSSWDITDPTDIKFLGKIQSNPGSNSIVHNTYAMGHWAITSWYKDGYTIVDVSRPDNLVQVGNYDSAPNEMGGGYGGCWGVYPYFPSGSVILSNTGFSGAPGELFILTPKYVQACHVEVNVTDASTGLPLSGVKVTVQGTNPLLEAVTTGNGQFKKGQEAEGVYNLEIKKRGYHTFDSTITLQHGVPVLLDVALAPRVLTLYPLRPGFDNDPGEEEVDARLETSEVAINQLLIQENPFQNEALVQYQTATENATITLINELGQTVQEVAVDGLNGQIKLGLGLPAGLYFAILNQHGKSLDVKKLVKKGGQ